LVHGVIQTGYRVGLAVWALVVTQGGFPCGGR
jgi:hypothetical protein